MDPWTIALFQKLLKDNSSQRGSAAESYKGELRCSDRGGEGANDNLHHFIISGLQKRGTT